MRWVSDLLWKCHTDTIVLDRILCFEHTCLVWNRVGMNERGLPVWLLVLQCES